MQNRSIPMLACGTAALLICAAAQAAPVNRVDREFLNTAATMDMTGAHAAQMAQDKAASGEVKDFARMLAKDDGESFGHLQNVAVKIGATIPRGIDTGRIPEIKALDSLNGTRFDRQFTHVEITAEQRALTVFRHEAKYGQNGDLKAYASRMIPVLDTDLKRAEECAKTAK